MTEQNEFFKYFFSYFVENEQNAALCEYEFINFVPFYLFAGTQHNGAKRKFFAFVMKCEYSLEKSVTIFIFA